MILRYTRPEMGRIWTTESRFRKWLEVELGVCEVQYELGVIPEAAWKTIKEKADFDLRRIEEIEAEVRHDVIAFLTSVAEKVGPDSRYIHLGMTSSDVLDTATALQLKEASALILSGLETLKEVLGRKAKAYKDTVMIGRSHGIHAEPTTFGLKLALYYEETKRNIARMQEAAEMVRVGKISGAVGTFSHLDPIVEERACAKLGLKPDPISTQIVQRDRHAHYLMTLALIGASIEKIALEIRHLQRTEVLEAEEYFGKGQKGSSAMPHKRNPITCEQLTGLARILRANAMAALENVALWHERDISHSSVERIILPDSTILIDYMLHKTIHLLDHLLVYPEQMEANLHLTSGLIFSQTVMLALVKKGITREEAYRLVQTPSMRCWQTREPFEQVILHDPEIRKVLSKEEIHACFDLKVQLRNVDAIFRRVGLLDPEA